MATDANVFGKCSGGALALGKCSGNILVLDYESGTPGPPVVVGSLTLDGVDVTLDGVTVTFTS